MYLSLHCYHQNDSCIKMGSDESDFINCEGQSYTTVSQTATFEEKGKQKRIRTEVPLLTSLSARPNRLTTGCGCVRTKPLHASVIRLWRMNRMFCRYACPFNKPVENEALACPFNTLVENKAVACSLILRRKTNRIFCRHTCPFN